MTGLVYATSEMLALELVVGRHAQRNPPAVIRRLGFLLLRVSQATERAQQQIRQSIDRPDDARERQQALRSFRALKASIDRYNEELRRFRERDRCEHTDQHP